MQSLKDLIKNLKNKDEIDAVFVTDLQCLGEEKSYSDIVLS